MVKRELLIKNFSRAAGTYDTNSDFQRKVGEELLIYHLPFKWLTEDPERLLDIGCGTGRLLNLLLGMYPYARFAACDIALSMAIEARKRVKSQRAGLLASDCESLPFKGSTFDIAVSNLTYQWATDLEGAFREVFKVLKPGGIFAFTTLGPLTFKELKESVHLAESLTGRGGLPSFMEFKGEEALERNLKRAGFRDIRIKTEPRPKYYRNLWELLRTLKSIGAGNNRTDGEKSLARGALLKGAARVYREEFPSPDRRGIVATYDVVFAAAKKPLSAKRR
jgi:malonyl-CoA O-methyltransferase